MANFDDITQRKTGFFHALGLVLTKKSNEPANEIYKSAHNVQTSEIWTDSVGYAQLFSDAENEALTNNAVTQHGSETSGTQSMALLYPLKDTDRQSWFLDTGNPTFDTNGFVPSSGWIKPLISIVDAPNSAGAPSTGYAFRLYTPSGTQISTLQGRWEIDYFAGFLKFAEGYTPTDTGNGLGFDFDVSDFLSAPDKVGFLEQNGPFAIAFQYTGDFLDEFLNNLPSSGGSGGSDEWQSSVNGYLIEIGNGENINGATAINNQISYLNTTYENYYILTNNDVTGNTWSLSTSSYYEYGSGSFSSYTLSNIDDENRFLMIENSQILDVVVISSTGSITTLPNTTVQEDRIIEYTGTQSTGLSQSYWQVTEPRVGMVTTLDNKENSMVRYVGNISGWVEYQYELTYKVNSQKGINASTTNQNFDIGIEDVVEFEPTGSKSINILVNGVEVPTSVYRWGSPSAFTALTLINSSTNSITIPNGESPSVGEYLQLNNGSSNFHRQVSTVSSGLTLSIATYSGSDVSSVISVNQFTITPRSESIGKKGDYLLWLGDNFYQLDNGGYFSASINSTVSSDLITLEYVTRDPGAINL